MAVVTGWLLCLWAALAANAQSFSCSNLENSDAFMLFLEGADALGIEAEFSPPGRLCLAQGSLSNTYTAITLFDDYDASSTTPGVPQSGTALVDVECTQSGTWMRVNQTAVTSLASNTLRTDCYTCGVEHMATSFCAVCSPACNEGLQHCTGPSSADCCNFFLNNSCVASCGFENRPNSTNHCVPTVFLNISIDSGEHINPGSPSTTIITDGAFDRITCSVGGPIDLASEVTPNLNWAISLTDTSITTFSNMPDGVPAGSYILQGSGGSATINVEVMYSLTAAEIVFSPRFIPQLQGMYSCTGNSTSEGETNLVANLVIANPYLALSGEHVVTTGFPTRTFTVPLTAQYRAIDGSQIIATTGLSAYYTSNGVNKTGTVTRDSSGSYSISFSNDLPGVVNVTIVFTPPNLPQRSLVLTVYSFGVTLSSSNRIEVMIGDSFSIACILTVPGVPVQVTTPAGMVSPSPLNVPSAVAGQSGVYLCRADFPGMVQANLTVTVLVFPSNVAIHVNLQFLQSLAIVNNFSPFDSISSLYTYSCVGFGSHDNLQWRFGGQLITNTSPETSEPYYLEMVSAREVRLVIFRTRVGQLGAIFECTSQAGATASMRLTVDDPFYMLHTVLPAPLSLGQAFTLQFTYAANSTGVVQPSTQTDLFAVLTTNTSTMLMTTVQRDSAYNYSIMLSAAQQFANENIRIRYNGSSVFFSPVINVSVTVPTVTFTQLMPPAFAQNELATLTCTPSNSLSPISWFNDERESFERLTTPPYSYTNNITRNQVMFRPYLTDLRNRPGAMYPPLGLNISPVPSVDPSMQPQLQPSVSFKCTVCSDDSAGLSDCAAAPQTQILQILYSPVTISLPNGQTYNNSVSFTVEGIFDLRCRSTAGNGNLMWRSSNTNLQQLLMSGNTTIGSPYNLAIMNSSLWSISLQIEPEDPNVLAMLAGDIDCVSQESGVFSTLTVVADIANPLYLRRQTEAVVRVPLGAPILLPFRAASMEANGDPFASRTIFNQLVFSFPNNDSMAPPSTCQSEGNLTNVLPQAYEISPYNYALYQQAAGILNAGVYIVQISNLVPMQGPPAAVNETFTVQITTPTLVGSPATITARPGDSVTFRCTPSDDRIRLRWFRTPVAPSNLCPSQSGPPGLIPRPIPGVGNSGTTEICSSQGQFSFDDNIKQHSLTVTVTGSLDEVISCYVRDPSVERPYFDPSSIGVNMSLNVIQTCQADFHSGLAWPPTEEGTIATLPCSMASSRFSSIVSVRRPCVDGIWSQVDYSGCTLATADADPFLILWFQTFDNPEGPAPSVEQVTAQRSAMETQIANRFENEGHNVTFTSFRTEVIVTMPRVVFIAMEVTTPSLTTLSSSLQMFINNGLFLLNQEIRIDDFNRGWLGFQSGNFCECFACRLNVVLPDQETPILPPMDYMRTCSGVSASPCNCFINRTCMCSEPFVGNGRLCTLDSDYDLFPDQPLPDQPPIGDNNMSSCSGSPKYCQQDNCVSVYNPTQDSSLCNPQQPSEGTVVCPNETDSTWRVNWPSTAVNTTATQHCPNAPAVAGLSTRQCDGNGVWGPVDVSACANRIIKALQAMSVVLVSNQQNNVPIVVEEVAEIIDELAMVTMNDGTNSSELPQDLEASNMILENSLQVLQQSLENGTRVNDTGIIQLLDNLLDQRNLPGWTGLQQQNSTSASEQLLDNAEVYGQYVARALPNPGDVSVMSRPNIALRAERVAVSDNTEGMAIQFPLAEDLQNFTSPLGTMEPASITIPAALLRERATAGSVTVSNLLINNIQSFLNSSNTSANIEPRTVVLSSQVDVQQRGSSAALQDDPVRMNFTVLTNNFSDPRCVYWRFSQPRGNGQWSSDGITTFYVNGSQQVLCNSTHLTSFAVLVDVSGVHTMIDPIEAQALSIVSYIGCTVSIICLALTIIFFISFGKKLFVSVNNLVHLNLAAALLAALIVFVAGIETATSNQIGCAVVAALLHYFFLSVFCWMLCEGVMLYLMLVVVFSRLSKKWWFFLLLGWVPPLVPVIIGLAAASDQYGVTDSNGTLLFCWLSTDGRPVIWAFAGPMIVILLINTVFLVLVMISLVKNKISRNEGVMSDKENRIDLVKSIIKASVILLPLLGLTWVIGLFAVNVNTTAFAWIFAILNSIQGVLIFFFHVIRNERVWNKLTKQYNSWKTSSKYTTASSGETSSTLGKSPIWKRKNNYSQGTLPSEKGVELQEKTPISTHENSPESLADLDEDLDEKPSTTNLPQPPENGAHSNHNDIDIV